MPPFYDQIAQKIKKHKRGSVQGTVAHNLSTDQQTAPPHTHTKGQTPSAYNWTAMKFIWGWKCLGAEKQLLLGS